MNVMHNWKQPFYSLVFLPVKLKESELGIHVCIAAARRPAGGRSLRRKWEELMPQVGWISQMYK